MEGVLGGLDPNQAFTLPTPSGLAAYSTSVKLDRDGQVVGKRGLAWWEVSQRLQGQEPQGPPPSTSSLLLLLGGF